MTPPIIQPTVGRIVWFYGVPYDDDTRKFGSRIGDQPMAAQICYVHGTDAVNLKVTDHVGRDFAVRLCQLYQGPDENGPPLHFNHCRWMPYQKAQAEKSGTVTLP